jgi:prolyl-tRNA synthetase
MVMSAAGEDNILFNEADGYAANVEMATSVLPALPDRDDIGDEVESFETPGILTIEALESFPGGAPAQHQIKTLVYVADGEPLIALLRGDHQLNESKLSSLLGASQLRPAAAEDIYKMLGAHPGSLGAVDLKSHRIVADEALRGRKRMTTGANADGFHLRGVDVERDISVSQWADLRTAQPGETSPNGGELQVARSIELGHVFKLGNKYTKAMNAKFLDESGKEQIIEMGCYGIGVSRIVAAIAEIHHDERGIVWPREVAPFQVHLLLLDKDAELTAIAEKLYGDLRAAGVDVLFDDRNERPGSKFADADLFGVPTQIMVGKTTRESGQVEVRQRADKSSTQLPANAVLAYLSAAS